MNSRPLMERPSRDPALNVRAPLCLPGALDSKASVRIRFCREQSLLSELRTDSCSTHLATFAQNEV